MLKKMLIALLAICAIGNIVNAYSNLKYNKVELDKLAYEEYTAEDKNSAMQCRKYIYDKREVFDSYNKNPGTIECRLYDKIHQTGWIGLDPEKSASEFKNMQEEYSKNQKKG